MKYRKLNKYKYQLMEDVIFKTSISKDILTNYLNIYNGWLRISMGYAWDGASSVAIDTDTIMFASLIHDCYYQLIREGHLPTGYRLVADRILRDLCLDAGMSRFRAWYVYHAVRMFGGGAIKPRKGSEVIEI